MTKVETHLSELLWQMTLEEKVALTIGQDFWSTNGIERLGIVPITFNDGPHGVRKPTKGNELVVGDSIPATCFPTAVSLASSWDVELAYEIGQALGEESLALDVQVLLGPGVNIKRTPLGGRNFEYYSEDPVLSGEMGAAWVNGVQSQGVGTSLKHYACNNQEWERLTISAEVDQRTLREIYLSAFERVVKKAHPWTIMAAYNKINGIYATEHSQLLTRILREEWGFEGMVVSDWGAVNEKSKALAAGLDLEMPGPGQNHNQKITRLILEGQLSEAVIDRAVSKVLDLLVRGITNRKPGTDFDREAHHLLARRAAAESIVLLKNNDNLLPLKLEELNSVAVIGQFATHPRYQGSGSSQVMPTKLDAPLDQLQSWLGPTLKVSYSPGYTMEDQPDEGLIQEAVRQAKDATIAIIFAGLPDSFESEGFDRNHLFMPESHNTLIEEVCRVQPKTIVILQNGSVVAMPWIEGPKAILEVGLGGQAVGGAVVDVLSGKVNPCGKLAETFPLRLEDTPAFLNYPGEIDQVHYGEGQFVGYRYYDKKKIKPLFPFGFGLSYTSFEFEELKINTYELKMGETLEIIVKVTNTGSWSGKEVIQLYVQPISSQYLRPTRELKAFAKVALEPGETKEVSLKLEDRDFMVYDTGRQSWRMEGGVYRVEVGGSSVYLPLTSEVTILESPASARRAFTEMTQIKYFLADQEARTLLTQLFAGTKIVDRLDEGDEMLMSFPVCKIADFWGLPRENIAKIVAQLNQG